MDFLFSLDTSLKPVDSLGVGQSHRLGCIVSSLLIGRSDFQYLNTWCLAAALAYVHLLLKACMVGATPAVSCLAGDSQGSQND